MTLDRKRLQKLLPVAYVTALIWISVYLCRQAFFIQYTGQMHSMHGFWIAMARLAGDAWYKPSWWPYWFGGMPFEFTYAPAVPALAAAIARLTGMSVQQAFNVVSALVFCAGPATLFLMAWALTRRAGWSFLTAIVYSLSALTELVLPDDRFALTHLGDARRLYLCFVWDEVPHQLALALMSLAIPCFAAGFRCRRRLAFCASIFCSAAALLSSAFAATDLAIATLCLLATCETLEWKRNLRAALICGPLGYLIACPYLPPSLLAAIRADANLFPESAFTTASLASLAAVFSAAALLWWVSRRWRQWHMRFFLLLTFVFTMIPLLQKWNLHFIPQPGRYKVEIELALALFLVFAVAPWIDRLPRIARIVLLAGFVVLAGRNLILQRRFAKNVIRSVDITQTIEYQSSRWLETNLPGQRVMAPGSIAQWMNAFTTVPQLSGGSYPTAPTAIGQTVEWGLLGSDDKSGTLSTLWLQAYGVDAIVISGKNSPEFWRPFQGKQQFEGLLPVLWNERDTRIYSVPRRNRSLTWVIPETAVVRATPRDYSDAAAIRTYVAAMEDTALPPADFQWQDRNHATIRAAVAPGRVLSVQVTYSAGWKATAGNHPVPISPDGLGQMILHPQCAGLCEIDLTYDGGWESKLCRALSLLALLGVIAFQIAAARSER